MYVCIIMKKDDLNESKRSYYHSFSHYHYDMRFIHFDHVFNVWNSTNKTKKIILD